MTTIEAAKQLIANEGRCLDIECDKCPIRHLKCKGFPKNPSQQVVQRAERYLRDHG